MNTVAQHSVSQFLKTARFRAALMGFDQASQNIQAAMQCDLDALESTERILSAAATTDCQRHLVARYVSEQTDLLHARFAIKHQLAHDLAALFREYTYEPQERLLVEIEHYLTSLQA